MLNNKYTIIWYKYKSNIKYSDAIIFSWFFYYSFILYKRKKENITYIFRIHIKITFLCFLGASPQNGEVSLHGIFNPIDPEYILACHFLHVLSSSSYRKFIREFVVLTSRSLLVPLRFIIIDFYFFFTFLLFTLPSCCSCFTSALYVARLILKDLGVLELASFVCHQFYLLRKILSIFLKGHILEIWNFYCCTFCTIL